MPTDEEDDELLDIVDENDRVIGVMPRDEVYAWGVHDFRIVSAFVRNSRGELWIPRRAAHKSMPLHLDTSMNGHVKSGETYGQAFIRETQEELGFAVAHVEWRHLGMLTPYADRAFCFIALYEIQSDVTPEYSQEEFCEAFWLTPQALIEKIGAGEPVRSDLVTMLALFYP